MLKKYLLIFLGSASWVVTMIKSGWIYSYGIGFWGANGHDGIWHIALAESLARGNFVNPVFSGYVLQNYHLGFDLIVAGLNIITKISVINLYFQVLPIIFAILIGFLTYYFVKLITKSDTSALLSVFFTYFGGDLAYIIGKGESTFWSQQSISTLINPPYALSLIFLLVGLIFLSKDRKLLAMIFFGILIETKVYAGILVIGALLVSKNYKVFFGTLLISLLLYLSFGNYSTGIIVFKPFWFLETMMGLSDHVGWTKFGEAMLNYRSGHMYGKEILTYGLAFIIFVLGNFGARLIFLKDIFKKLDSMKILMLSIIIAGILIPTFFVQSGTPWNTIQFLYYSLFFAGILSAISLTRINKYVVVSIILLTIPTTILTLKDVYLPSRPPSKLSTGELSALNYLSKQPSGTVLTYPFDQIKANDAVNNPPRPLYLYTSTAYVSAFSNHQTFLEDETNLDITGYGWQDRKKKIENWYKEKDQKLASSFLKDNNIKYVYWVKPQRALLGESQLGLTKIFENGEVNLYVVK